MLISMEKKNEKNEKYIVANAKSAVASASGNTRLNTSVREYPSVVGSLSSCQK
jgi:hypothetical protein